MGRKRNKNNKEKALTSYRDYLINDSLQYPMNVPKVNASSVLREGDYVFFVIYN